MNLFGMSFRNGFSLKLILIPGRRPSKRLISRIQVDDFNECCDEGYIDETYRDEL